MRNIDNIALDIQCTVNSQHLSVDQQEHQLQALFLEFVHELMEK